MTELQGLLARIGAVEQRLRQAVAERRAADPNPDDQFRGLYLSDEAIDALLEGRREPFAPPEAADAGPSRLTALAAAAQLTDLDVELLLVAMAPDVDSRFEQFYGYLNDDVTRRRATVGLALRLCGLAEAEVQGRARFEAASPLIASGLVTVGDIERPLLTRSLRVPDRVTAHLLGGDGCDPVAAPLVEATTPVSCGDERLASAIAAGTGFVYLHEGLGGSAAAAAAAAFAASGRATLAVDCRLLPKPEELAETATALAREAVLRGAGIVAGPVDAGSCAALLARLDQVPVPLVLFGSGGWDPEWSRRQPLLLSVGVATRAERADLWRDATGEALAEGVDLAAETAHFTLSVRQINRAAEAAAQLARAEGGPIRAEHLRYGVRSQNAAGLEHLARRIEPAVGWDDLVLPPPILDGIRELAVRARRRDLVLDEWRMRPGGGRGMGVTGLFAGDSGTGKTMSAEVIAADLGMDLYTVNLATVVDKYIGETEKNLEKIFTEAAGVNGVLLFDEADAIFGKRSEVRDAHDRYANVESAYLLQRMESFEGLAILATNLRANLDEAFTRRLDVVVDFPVPDPEQRLLLWDRCLGRAMPRAADLDLEFLADAFELAGGHIRSAAVTAGYLTAEAGGRATMATVVAAVAREYRKLGRLCLEREFGDYLELVI
ncbi:ATP-binding protein [Glycomyces niveus]|uniref:ATP-binding protein n=1 Tax=Glycomyces niveus TaxID=2820287 RepID=A0ABS3U6S2_9ACTN|nr:ATP-binding protein [Glycomyces sp. NEAU-S30]MBO3734436.1 ATP-binding protein [Glycomyces sp. NEAU-S30]